MQAQARASGERWRRGQPLSPLDGVPVAIKDELDLVPYATGGGARVFPATPAKRDAAVAARLRAAGAILCGKTSMHELGIGVTGMNPHHRVRAQPARPGARQRGIVGRVGGRGRRRSGAAGHRAPTGAVRSASPRPCVAPSGIKPTFGRVSDAGALRLCWSVGHVGPHRRQRPRLRARLPGVRPGAGRGRRRWATACDDFERPALAGLRLGIYRPWFQHAQPQVVQVCEALLAALERRGARLVEVDAAGPGGDPAGPRADHRRRDRRRAGAGVRRRAGSRLLSAETRINVALARRANSIDYVQAQRVRTQALATFHTAFEAVDVLVTPTTAHDRPGDPPGRAQGGRVGSVGADRPDALRGRRQLRRRAGHQLPGRLRRRRPAGGPAGDGALVAGAPAAAAWPTPPSRTSPGGGRGYFTRC